MNRQTMHIEPERVRRSFSLNAGTYDSNADIQKLAAGELLTRITSRYLNSTRPPRILDIGSGTGAVAVPLSRLFPESEVVAADSAFGMSHLLRQSANAGMINIGTLTAEAGTLPLKTGSIDLAVSSLAFQWVHPLEVAFNELARVVRPGGSAIIAMLGEGTFAELHDAYRITARKFRKPDRHLHRFAGIDDIFRALRQADWDLAPIESRGFEKTYKSLENLMRTVKSVGAQNASPLRPRGLAGKKFFHEFRRVYASKYPANGGIRASYAVYYLDAVRRGA